MYMKINRIECGAHKNGKAKKQPESKFTDSSNTHQPKELFYTNALQLTKEDYFT